MTRPQPDPEPQELPENIEQIINPDGSGSVTVTNPETGATRTTSWPAPEPQTPSQRTPGGEAPEPEPAV